MPLKGPHMHGTDKNGLRIEDYCVYCYKDGEFTEDVTMDEMIRLCSRYVEGNSRNVAVVGMKLQYPRLKRWARKEETQHESYKAITRVMQYIQEHLDESTNLQTLADIANLSPFHFHRIFKLTIGESLAEYVQRLRMEYVAEKLQSSGLSLCELAEQTGYSSEQALSRAFKKYFSIPPRTYKISFYSDKFGDDLIPRVCRMARKNIISLKQDLPDKQSWQKLYMYALFNRLLSDSTESLEIIKGDIFYPALTTKDALSANNMIIASVLPEGIYAIFTHKGDLDSIPQLFKAIFNYWLATSKYTICAETAPYVKYLNNPAEVAKEDILAEIYIRVLEK